MACNCNNSTPQPCCQDCPEVNPCSTGCLDIIPSSCIEHDTALTCIGTPVNTKLDVVLETIETKICSLQSAGDKFVRISAVDTTSGYLFDKILTCDYLTKTIVTQSGQQKLELCINVDNLLSDNDENPIFEDLDGLNIDYELLVNHIVNTPALLQVLCDAIDGCTPTP